MADRQGLQDLLLDLMGPDAPNVYFQPPEGHKYVYPCIRYEVDDVDTKFADNKSYTKRIGYLVTFMTEDPDDPRWLKLLNLTLCSFSRHYPADGLHNYVYILFF